MITVGIQDNIRLLEASKNDRGTLVIKAQQDAGGGGDLLSQLSSTSSQTMENENDYYFWPIQEDDRADSEAEKYKSALNSLKTLRAQLNHILEQYITSDKIHWNPTGNLGFTPGAEAQELAAGLQDSAKRAVLLTGIYNNYVDQFIAQLTPHIGPASPLFRMKLPRQNAEKNFSSIPKFAPFMEPMSVPKNASQLKWSNYELGFRKGDDVKNPKSWTGVNLSSSAPAEGAGAKAGKNASEAAAVANLFGAK